MVAYLLPQNIIFFSFSVLFNHLCKCFETLLWKICDSGFESKLLCLRKQGSKARSPFGNTGLCQSYLPSLSCVKSVIYAGILRDFTEYAIGYYGLYLA